MATDFGTQITTSAIIGLSLFQQLEFHLSLAQKIQVFYNTNSTNLYQTCICKKVLIFINQLSWSLQDVPFPHLDIEHLTDPD